MFSKFEADGRNFVKRRRRSRRKSFVRFPGVSPTHRQSLTTRYFSSGMIAITQGSERQQRVVAHSAAIPAGLRRSVKPRLHPSSGDECKRRRGRVGPIGLFIFVPITVARFQPSASFVFLARLRFLLSDEAKEGCATG